MNIIARRNIIFWILCILSIIGFIQSFFMFFGEKNSHFAIFLIFMQSIFLTAIAIKLNRLPKKIESHHDGIITNYAICALLFIHVNTLILGILLRMTAYSLFFLTYSMLPFIMIDKYNTITIVLL